MLAETFSNLDKRCASRKTVSQFSVFQIYCDCLYCVQQFQILLPEMLASKDIALAWQEKNQIENENQLSPAKPILLQMKKKANHFLPLVPAKYRSVFQDSSLYLVFVDTENNSRHWTLEYCRELSFYSAKLGRWLFFDVDMDEDHAAQMEYCFNQLLELFPDMWSLYTTITQNRNCLKNSLVDLKGLLTIPIVICLGWLVLLLIQRIPRLTDCILQPETCLLF